jgi:hypothetical protein
MGRSLEKNYFKYEHNDKLTVKQKKQAGIISNPGFLVSRKIYDIGEKLLDFIPKLANHLSVNGAKRIEDPSERLLKYSITLNNKIHSCIFKSVLF